MSNYKIRVNSKAESKEVQDFAKSDGYSRKYNNFTLHKGWVCLNSEKDILCVCHSQADNELDDYKEITIPQLHDLVVLKRNDVGDANAFRHDNDVKYYITSDNKYYYFLGIPTFQWTESCNDIDYLEKYVKPIEKKEMKEYLRKNSNNTYSYIGTVRPEHVSDFMIEIPEGGNFAVYSISGCLAFHKDRTSGEFFNVDSGCWCENGRTLEGRDIVWQRHTHPEELPFIDDEPSLNDQYAEIEKVRQSHRTASEIADSALKHIRERAETYDQPTGERSAAKTAKAFNAITGKDITESEVWLLLQLLKDVRQWSREDYHQDSAEDCIAYAALKAESLEGGE